MHQEGYVVALLSGELDVTQRATILKRFRDGKERVLVTTNVCARGIDVEQVTLVVNFDLPMTKVSSKTIVYSDYSIVYRQGYSKYFFSNKNLILRRTFIELVELVVLVNLELQLILFRQHVTNQSSIELHHILKLQFWHSMQEIMTI